MSNQPKRKVIYLYTKGSANSNWKRMAGPHGPSKLRSLSMSGRNYKQQVKEASTTGVGPYRRPRREAFWAVIEVDENVQPLDGITDQDLAQYKILASG